MENENENKNEKENEEEVKISENVKNKLEEVLNQVLDESVSKEKRASDSEEEVLKEKYYIYAENMEQVKLIVKNVSKQDIIVVLDFYLDTCIPCKFLDKVFLSILKEFEENPKEYTILIIKINPEQEETLMEMANTFHITTVPALIFLYLEEHVEIVRTLDDGTEEIKDVVLGLQSDNDLKEMFENIYHMKEEILKLKKKK